MMKYQMILTQALRRSGLSTFLPLHRALLLCFLAGFQLHGESITLAWDANQEPDVAGYHLYYQELPGGIPVKVDAGTQTQLTLTGLIAGRTYSFFATAYNTAGLESDPSTPLEHTVSIPPGAPFILSGTMDQNGVAMVWSSIPGRSYRVVASSDLASAIWTAASGDLLASGTSLYWQDTTVATNEKRFYKIELLP